jgi:NTP pyrophosphatase (non-canonical NTP hydrolase)
MDFKDYQRLAWITMRKDMSVDDQIMNCALGLGESGEVQNLIKKAVFHKHGYTPEICDKIGDEIGDVLWYLACLCEAQGIELEDMAIKNIEKLKKRYPEGFAAERSINRD